MVGEQLQVLRVRVVRQRVHSGGQVRQAALLGLELPRVRVAVAVEDDALVLLDDALNERIERAVEVLLALELVGKLLELFGEDRVQHDVRTCDVELRAEAAELELVAGEGERRGAVAVRRVLREGRQDVDADLHVDAERAAVDGAGLDRVEDRGQLVAEEDGDDGRRRFVRAEAVVVARGGDGDAQQILILVDALDDRGEEEQELRVLLRQLAGLEQVLARVGGDRPVVVLAGAVDTRERLLVQQADEAVALRHVLHHFHGELVVVGGDVGRREDRRELMLCRRDLVVLCL